jgi:hypothetical protein
MLSGDRLLLSNDERTVARANVKRLKEMPPAELAAAIMPVFGPDGPPVRKLWWGAQGIEVLQICDWLMRDHQRGYRQRPRLRNAVTRALHLLDEAGLIENTRRWARPGALAAVLRPTALGQAALIEGTVRKYLGIS